MSDPNIEARILLALRALQNDPKLSHLPGPLLDFISPTEGYPFYA
jgi:hypothetical protein